MLNQRADMIIRETWGRRNDRYGSRSRRSRCGFKERCCLSLLEILLMSPRSRFQTPYIQLQYCAVELCV